MGPLFVGRERELADLVRIGRAALAGPAAAPVAGPAAEPAAGPAADPAADPAAGPASGAVVLLAGEAGIGKSTLLDRFVRCVARDGVPGLSGRAVAEEGVPELWPWRRLLEQGVGGLGPGLVSLERASEFDPPAAIRFRAFERTVRALRAAAEPAGLIVTIEDLHWADTASLALLRYLCGEAGSARMLVAGTFREPDGEQVPDLMAAAAAAPVRVQRLGPLDAVEVARYLRAYADGRPVDDSWAARIHRRSGGNPLFVRELAGLLVREGLLARPATELPVPAGLRQVVAQHLARLDDGCRDVLAGCAAIGEEVDTELLAAADARATGQLAAAVAAGVLVEDPARPRTVRFSHDLVRQVCYHELDRLRRVAWHARIADALEATGCDDGRSDERRSDESWSDDGRSDDGRPGERRWDDGRPGERRLDDRRSGELARHRVSSAIDAAGRRAAVSACRQAAEADLRRLAFASARRWYGEAVHLSDDDAERCASLLGRAEAAFRDGQVGHALDDCAAAMDEAERLGRADLAAAAALVVRGVGGDAWVTLAGLCDRAVAVMGAGTDRPEPALQARLLALQSMALAEGAGNATQAEPLSRRAMELAEDSGDPAAVIDALNSRRLVMFGPGGVAELLAIGRRMREVAASAGRPDAALWGHIWRVDAALQLGSIDAVDAEIFELTTLVERLGWPLARWHLLRIQSTRALITGRFADARRLIEETLEVARQTQDASAHYVTYAAVSNLQMLTGRPERHADEVRSMEDATDLALMIAGRSVFHARMGDTERAAALFERIRSRMQELQPEPRWTATMFYTGEAAARLGDEDAARVCYRLLLPFEPYYVNLSPGANGAMARVLGLLAATLGDLEAAEAHLARAVAMENRIGALPFLAFARFDHATVLAARGAPGDKDRAVRLAEAAAETGRRLGMETVTRDAARLLRELSGREGGPATLTPAERTIAGLVARGRTNREIAAELVVSVRTVETHVRNILRKAGLSNRTQLAAWSLRAGLGGRPDPGEG